MTRFIILLSVLFISSTTFSQRAEDWSLELDGPIKSITFHQVTGIPVVQTSASYTGVNADGKDILWTFDRGKLQGINDAMAGESDIYEVQFTPYLLIGNSLLDSRDGNVIIDASEAGHKRVISYELIPELNTLLLSTVAEGMNRLYMVNMSNHSLEWQSDVFNASGLAEATTGSGEAKGPKLNPVGTSLFTSSELIFQHKKRVAAVNLSDGKLLWEEKPKPAEVFLSPDNSIVYVIGKAGGLIAGSIKSALTTKAKAYGKEMYAFDAKTGKEVWKKKKFDDDIKWYELRDKNMLVVYRGGCNFYDYHSGENLWKKNFEEKRIKSVEENSEGYLVHYKWKKMQLGKDGKKAWKKPEKIEFAGGSEFGEEEATSEFDYKNGIVHVSELRAAYFPTDSGEKNQYFSFKGESPIFLHNSENNDIAVLDQNGILVINPDRLTDIAIRTNDEMNKVSNATLESRGKTYTAFNNQEILLLNIHDFSTKYKFYPRPTSAGSIFSDLAVAAIGTAGVVNSMSGAGQAFVPGRSAQANRNMSRGNTMMDMANYAPERRRNFMTGTSDYIYFFTKEKSNDEKLRLLIKVDKDSGEETDKLIFDNTTPIYEIDEVDQKVYYGSSNTLKVFEMK